MRDYIILNNKNSNEIKGLLIQNLPPITKPRIRAEIEEIDGRDGDIVTPLGYGAYDKVFSIGLYGDFDINEVIKYFDSEGIVVFSNEPNKYYNYKILEQIDFEKLIRFRTADVMMHVQPFKYSTTEGKETEEMETKTASGSEIDLPDTNNEKLQMEKLKGDTHQDTIDAEEGNENEDTNLAVNDVDPSKENYITLKGNTTQDQHESPNLLQIDAPATQEFYGITITNNGDGTITLNGTATNPLELYLPNLDMATHYLGIKKDTDYFLNGCMASGSLNTYNFIIEGETWYADTGNGVQFNSHSDSAVHAYLSIARGVTLDNAIFKPMLIEGTEAQEFEPYGKVTPSPDYPSEVKVVKGENVVSVQGKNLIPNQKNNVTSQGVTFTANEDGTYLISGKNSGVGNSIVTLFSNQNYILEPKTYYTIPTNNEKVTIVLYVTYEDNTNQYININRGIQSSVKINKKVVKANAYLQVAKGTTETYVDYKVYPILTEKPVDVDTYVPYSKTDYPINLGTLELCKIGDYKDYLFKRNGKWYVHKKIGKDVFNGSESWDFGNVGINKVKKFFLYVASSYAPMLVKQYSNYAEWALSVYNYGSGNKFQLEPNRNLIVVAPENMTLEQFKEKLNTIPMLIYYVLATPTETEITDTSLIAQLDALHTAELQETSYINSTPVKEYPYINLKYNVVTPAPSPDRASEINKVTGNNVISVQGKNLFDVSKLENASWNYPNAPTRLVMFLDKANQGTKMSVTNLDTTTYRFSVGFAKLGYASQSNTIVNESGWTTNSTYTITANNDGYPFLQISRLDNANISASEVEDKFQFEYSDTASEYTPFSKTDYPLSLGTLELCKIGNYQDYLYKNNGKWYVHKEINKIVFDGSESWVLSSLGAGRFYLEISPIFKMISGTAIGIKPYSSHFVGKDNSLGFENGKVVFMTSSYGGTTHYFARFENDNTPTLSEWKTWLSNNNVKLYYVLATPTEEEITDETLLAQLEALDNIYNQKGTTYIKTNPEANNMPLSLDVSYTESKPITITNSGNIYSKPIFTIYGEGNIGVYLNDIQLFNINLGSEEQITIDVAEMQAYNKETKALKNRLVTGNYDNFVLKVGENKISFSGIVKKFEIENYSRWI